MSEISNATDGDAIESGDTQNGDSNPLQAWVSQQLATHNNESDDPAEQTTAKFKRMKIHENSKLFGLIRLIWYR